MGAKERNMMMTTCVGKGGKHFAPAPSDADPRVQSWGVILPLKHVGEYDR